MRMVQQHIESNCLVSLPEHAEGLMIGKPLSKLTKRKLIGHVGEIEQPWNCPHGRPIVRHLINTDMLLKAEEDNDDDSSKHSEFRLVLTLTTQKKKKKNVF